MRQYPAYVCWDVTGNCNHKCFYCYNYWRTEKSDFSNNAVKEFSEIADFIISKKPVAVIISGGEPCLVFDKLKEQIVKLYENGIYARILTNGSLITDDSAEFCKQYKINLMVSFPSADRKLFGKITNNEDNFDAVIKGIDCLYRHNVSFSPNLVISKMNMDDFEKTVGWLIDRYHPKKLFISRVTRPANASEIYDQFVLEKDDLQKIFIICERLAKIYKIEISGCGGTPFCIFPSKNALKMFGKRCGAGKNGYCVDMGGYVRACARDSQSIGNIFTDDFLELRKELIEWSERQDIPDKCKECKIENICRGGCRMTNYDYLRNGKAVDCDANPEKAPKIIPHYFVWLSLVRLYKVQDDIKCVSYDDTYRLSYLHQIVYVDRKVAEYILKENRVSVVKMIFDLHISLSSAKKCIFQLLCSNIIKK